MIKFIFPCLLATSGPSANAATAAQSEFEFKNGTVYFQVIKNKERLSYADSTGSRQLEIRNCNRPLIEKYWKELVKSAESLQSSRDARVPAAGAWVKYEGIHIPVLPFEPALHRLNRVPFQSQFLFAESRNACKSK